LATKELPRSLLLSNQEVQLISTSFSAPPVAINIQVPFLTPFLLLKKPIQTIVVPLSLIFIT